MMDELTAKNLGYDIIAASPFEVGLIKNGKGIVTWWASEFGYSLPTLNHPVIQKAINITEENHLA